MTEAGAGALRVYRSFTAPSSRGAGLLDEGSRRPRRPTPEPILIAHAGQTAQTAAPADATEEGGAPSAPVLPLVLHRMAEDQAEGVVTIDLAGKSDMADALVIASGRNQRHVGAIADKLRRDLKDAGHGNVPVEGLPAADWVLIDAGDVVVHLFRPEVRAFYKLERMWAPENFPPQGNFPPEGEAADVAQETAGAPDTHAGTDEALAV